MDGNRRTFLKLAASLPALSAQALPAPPKLLVLLIAGQFRTDYLDSHTAIFGPAGFNRLLKAGAYYPDCRIESTTFTASGLATIATGAYPNVHGIVADHWFDGAAHDSDPKDLAATTLTAARNFTLRAPDPPSPAQTYSWQALGSSNAPPMRIIAPNPARPADFAQLWKASPPCQAAQFALARDLIAREHLGRANGTDCLTIVLDSLAELGYETGANSPLVFDLVSHLDRQLESFLDYLDSILGPANYHLAFTAAHGAPDTAAQTIRGEQIAAAAGPSVQAYLYPFLYLKGAPRREDRIAIAEAVRHTGLVNAWYTSDGECSHTGDFRRRLENSFYHGRSGDILFAYPPGAVEYYGEGRGISYGSIYNYDARVPLIFFGPRFRARVFEDPVELIDIAPTLARALSLPIPSSSTGRVLGDAFQ